MFFKPAVPAMCAVTAILSFALAHLLPQGRADYINESGTYTQALGSKCCKVSSGCPTPGYGCTSQSTYCGDPYDVNCVLWNITDMYVLGSCQNGNRGNCDQYEPFYCAAGTLFTDPNNTGQCLSANAQCTLKEGTSGPGCQYDSSNGCTATN